MSSPSKNTLSEPGQLQIPAMKWDRPINGKYCNQMIEFTFFATVHKSSDRIDLILIPKTSLQSGFRCAIGDIIISDHAAAFIEI